MEYLIVADDYTGAAEMAAKFMNGGYRTAITLDHGSLGSIHSYAAVALDTETFFSSPQEAEEKLTAVTRDLLPWKNSVVFFKRIEPALRGNVGPEVHAMARVLRPDRIAVVPAFSRGRRSIEEGTVYLDVSGSLPPQTVTPYRSATLEATSKTLRDAGMNPIEVSLDDVRSGNVPKLFASDKGCFCFDAETDEDLRAITQGILSIVPEREVLWVGAMGLAEALAMTPRPYIFVVGTAHPRSVRQARQLLDQRMAVPVFLNADTLEKGNAAVVDERTRAAEEAETLLRCGQSILLAATVNGRFVRGSYPNDDFDGFLCFLADTVREILGRVRLGGLCITGGDCTLRVIRRIRAESVLLVEEIQEGISLSRVSGGPFDGLPLVTKSGSLGGERALLYCLEHLQQRTKPVDFPTVAH